MVPNPRRQALFTSQNDEQEKIIYERLAVSQVIRFILLVDLNLYFRPVVLLVLLPTLASAYTADSLPALQTNQTLAAGQGFSVSLSGNGQIWTVGTNQRDELGAGATIPFVKVPVQVAGLTGSPKSVAAGDHFGVALLTNGSVVYWGHGLAGLPDANAATAISGATNVRTVKACGNSALFLFADGTVATLDGSATSPVPVPGVSSVSTIACGAGDYYVVTGGLIYDWGAANSHGELGQGNTASVPTPTKVQGLTEVLTVAAARGHAMALTGARTAYSWGVAQSVGLNVTSDQLSPAAITGLGMGVKFIVASGSNSFLVTSNGSPWGAGPNAAGSLGVGTSTPVGTFTQIVMPAGIIDIAGDSRHTLFRQAGNMILACGDNSSCQLSLGNVVVTQVPFPTTTTLGDACEITDMAAGNGFSAVLDRNGVLRMVGANNHGQLGQGTSGTPITSDVAVSGQYVGVNAGDSFVAAWTASGQLYTWGYGGDGEMAQGGTSDCLSPTLVPLAGVYGAACGDGHVIGQTTSGVYAWGRNNHFQCSPTSGNVLSPLQIMGITGTVTGVAAGGDHDLLLLAGGTAMSLGSNESGEAGIGTTTDVSTPTFIPGLSSLVGMAAGYRHSLFLDNQQNVYASGSDFYGELMDGGSTNQFNPETITSLAQNGIIELWAGHGTSFALTPYDYDLAAGLNGDGQLCDGDTDNSSTPVWSAAPASMIAPGHNHSLFVYNNGLQAAGDNTSAELDISGISSAPYPVTPNFVANTGVDVYLSLSGGWHHSLASDEFGNLLGWGDNSFLQAGGSLLIPTIIPGTNPIEFTSAGKTHSIALDAMGTTWFLGDNSAGAAGDGTTTSQSTPEYVPGVYGVIATAAASGDTYWLLDNGTLLAAGSNQWGQIGDGTTINRTSPVAVAGVSNAAWIEPGNGWAMAGLADGRVMAWGNMSGTGTATSTPTPFFLPGVGNAISGAAGSTQGIILGANGIPSVFNSGTYGNLGLINTPYTSTPTALLYGDGTPVLNAIGATAGDDFSVLRFSNGSAAMMGSDSYNQFGDGQYNLSVVPVAVSFNEPLSFLSAGGEHLLAQFGDGTTTFQGADGYGQLGNGQIVNAPPQAPTNFTTTLDGSTEIDLSWLTSGDSGDSYEIDENVGGSNVWTFVTLASAQTTGYAATGLTPGVTYTFRIIAESLGGPAQPVVSTPILVPYALPGTPTSLHAVTAGPGRINLSWTPGNNSPTTYTILVSADGGVTWTTLANVPTAYYYAAGLLASKSYQFKVFGVNGAQQLGLAASVSATTVAPPAKPPRPNATVQGPTTIALQWSAGDSTTVAYQINEQVNGSGTWTPIATVSTLSYTVAGLLPNTGYQFEVFALNSAGQASTAAVSVAVHTPYATPAAVTGLQVLPNSPTSFTFAWTDPNGSNETAIDVQTLSSTGSLTTVAVLAAGTTSYTATNTSVAPSNYVITAVNSIGSAQSSQASHLQDSSPRYGLINLGTFIPAYVSDNGIITGVDQSYNIARWTPNGVTELTINGAPRICGEIRTAGSALGVGEGTYCVNNSGDVVVSYWIDPWVVTPYDSTVGQYLYGGSPLFYGDPEVAVHWSGAQIDAAPITNPGFSVTQMSDDPSEPADTITSPLPGQIEYDLITDNGKIYGQEAVAFLGAAPVPNVNNAGTSLNYNVASPGGSVTIDEHVGISTEIRDGMQFPNIELGVAPVAGVNPSYTASFPLCAANGLVVTGNEYVPISETGTVLPLTVRYNGATETLQYPPNFANNFGLVFSNIGSQTGYQNTTSIHCWDCDAQTDTIIWPNHGDYLSGVNSRETIFPGGGGFSKDYQAIGVFTVGGFQAGCIFEQLEKQSGQPSGYWCPTPISSLIATTTAQLIGGPSSINDNGVMTGSVISGNGAVQGAIFFPVELGVDANRDGTIVMQNDHAGIDTYDSNGNALPPDITTPSKPYRFWINDNEDVPGAFDSTFNDYPPETVPPVQSHLDWMSDSVVSARDLQDWSRLRVWISGIDAQIKSANIFVGLKWTASSGNPGIKLIEASDSSGGLGYLHSIAAGKQQAAPDSNDPGNGPSATARLVLKDALDLHTNIVPSTNPSSPADFIFPAWVWKSLADNHCVTNFLFEGTSVGAGELQVVFLTRNANGTFNQIGSGGQLYLDLMEVSQMYDRGHSVPTNDYFPTPYAVDPTTPPTPYSINAGALSVSPAMTFAPGDYQLPGHDTSTGDAGNPQEPQANPAQYADPDETSQLIVLVHGVTVTLDSLSCYSHNMYKRLWWSGYKGRFAAFQWSTPPFPPQSILANLLNLDDTLTLFNNGEYKAWNSGPALTAFVASEKNAVQKWNKGVVPSVGIAAHSLGNVVANSAFSSSTNPLTANYYCALEGAISLSCFFPSQNNTGDKTAILKSDTLYSLFDPDLLGAEIPASPLDPILPPVGSLFQYYGASTPDIYRQSCVGTLTHAGVITNYCNASDFWLQTGYIHQLLPCNWKMNEYYMKPTVFNYGFNQAGVLPPSATGTESKIYGWNLAGQNSGCGYRDDVYSPSILPNELTVTPSLISSIHRPVNDPYEQMSYIARSRTDSLGSQVEPQGQSIQSDARVVDLYGKYGFTQAQNDHSGIFNRSIQQLSDTSTFSATVPLYDQLRLSLTGHNLENP